MATPDEVLEQLVTMVGNRRELSSTAEDPLRLAQLLARSVLRPPSPERVRADIEGDRYESAFDVLTQRVDHFPTEVRDELLARLASAVRARLTLLLCRADMVWATVPRPADADVLGQIEALGADGQSREEREEVLRRAIPVWAELDDSLHHARDELKALGARSLSEERASAVEALAETWQLDAVQWLISRRPDPPSRGMPARVPPSQGWPRHGRPAREVLAWYEAPDEGPPGFRRWVPASDDEAAHHLLSVLRAWCDPAGSADVAFASVARFAEALNGVLGNPEGPHVVDRPDPDWYRTRLAPLPDPTEGLLPVEQGIDLLVPIGLEVPAVSPPVRDGGEGVITVCFVRSRTVEGRTVEVIPPSTVLVDVESVLPLLCPGPDRVAALLRLIGRPLRAAMLQPRGGGRVLTFEQTCRSVAWAADLMGLELRPGVPELIHAITGGHLTLVRLLLSACLGGNDPTTRTGSAPPPPPPVAAAMVAAIRQDPAFREEALDALTGSLSCLKVETQVALHAAICAASFSPEAEERLIGLVTRGDIDAVISLYDRKEWLVKNVMTSEEVVDALADAVEQGLLEAQPAGWHLPAPGPYDLIPAPESRLKEALEAYASLHAEASALVALRRLRTAVNAHVHYAQNDITGLRSGLGTDGDAGRHIKSLSQSLDMLKDPGRTELIGLRKFTETILAEMPRDFPTVSIVTTGLPSDVEVEANRIQLKAALDNLIRNACDAVSTHGKSQNVRVVFDAGYGQVTMDVEDSGPGIDSDIFEKHVNGNRGLAVTNAVLHEAHGTLTLKGRSDELGGAVVRVTLPLAEPEG